VLEPRVTVKAVLRRLSRQALKFRKELLLEVFKYVGTGIIGAAVVYGYTLYQRLPQRAITTFPAGAQVFDSVVPRCDETLFMAETVNTYLTTEFEVPPCEEPLRPVQRRRLVNDLKRSHMTWDNERLVYLRKAHDQLTELRARGTLSDRFLRAEIRRILDDLAWISRDLRADLRGAEQLEWASRRVSEALHNVSAERDHIVEFVEVYQGHRSERLLNYFELFIVVSNASDVEHYFPTQCTLDVGGGETAMSLVLDLADAGGQPLPVKSLAYIPLLPGRGQLLRLTKRVDPGSASRLRGALQAAIMTTVTCELVSGRVHSRPFDLSRFAVEENP